MNEKCDRCGKTMLQADYDAEHATIHVGTNGTPERAARTLFRIDNSCCEYEVSGKKQSCVTCPLNMNGEAYRKYAEQVECEKPQSEENGDTRERLEADIRAWHRDTPFATKPSVQTLLDWLDRQAAITRYDEQGMHDFILDNLQQECDKLTGECDKLTAAVEKWADAANAQRLVAMEQADKVCELTAERDELQAAIDAMGNGQGHQLHVAREHRHADIRARVREGSGETPETNQR